MKTTPQGLLCLFFMGLCTNALAQYRAPPDVYISKALTPAAVPRICRENVVAPKKLLGEIAVSGGINVLSLETSPTLSTGEIADTPEARLGAWLIATKDLDQAQAEKEGLSKDYYSKLTDIRFELVEYLISASTPNEDAVYRLTDDSRLGDSPDTNHGLVLESLLADALGGNRKTGIRLACAPPRPKPDENKGATKSIVALRGKIDDLAIPRLERGSDTPSAAFGKSSDAKLAYTDDGVKREESVSAELAFAFGRQFSSNDAILGFVHYVQSSTETRIPDDDDDSKDIRAISPGILYRHSLGDDGPLYATAGVTTYRTHDLAQDSRLSRARFFLSDIMIRRSGAKDVCGAEQRLAGTVYFSCRLGLFAEVARVHDAGRSTDMADNGDDQYTGIGFNTGITFWTSEPAGLAPFWLGLDYRRMQIVSGDLDNPRRFVVELGYTVPKSNISISFSRTVGENFETFQKEDVNKLSVGFKY